MMSANLINIVELAFFFRHKNIIAFLTINLGAVFLSIKDDFCRYCVKSLAFAPFYVIDALFAGKWHRSLIVYKMRHYVFL